MNGTSLENCSALLYNSDGIIISSYNITLNSASNILDNNFDN